MGEKKARETYIIKVRDLTRYEDPEHGDFMNRSYFPRKYQLREQRMLDGDGLLP